VFEEFRVGRVSGLKSFGFEEFAMLWVNDLPAVSRVSGWES